MSEPLRRRVRHRAGTTPTLSTDPTRVVLRRRRCGELVPRAHFAKGGAWRQVLLVGLVLLAAGPVWALGEALAERYHEEIAVFVEQTRQHLDWASVRAPEAAPSRPFVQSAPAAKHASGGTFASARGSGTTSGAARTQAAAPAAVMANPSVSRPVASSFPVFAPLAPEGMRPVAPHAARADTRASAGPLPAVTAPTTLDVDAKNNNSPYALNTGTTVTASGGAIVGDTSTGVLNQNGGTLTSTTSDGEGVLGIGTYKGSTGTYNLQSGIVTVDSLLIGGGAGTHSTGDGGGNGMFLQSGGTVTVTSGLAVGYDTASVSSYSLSAGSLASSYTVVGGYGKGTFTLSGTGTQTTGDLVLDAYASTGSGTYNLNGGTLTANTVSRGSTGTGIFNFNGGTLRAGKSDNPGAATGATTFMTGLTAANVQAGGARIDTNGFNVTINQTLTSGTASGTVDGGLTKTGAGTLTLGGSSDNNYTGLTSVTGGTLVLDKNPGSIALNGDLSIGNATNPGSPGSVVTQIMSNTQVRNTNVTTYADGVFDLNNNSASIGSLTMTGGEVHTGTGQISINGTLTTNASATTALISSDDVISGVPDVSLGQATTFNVARGTATYDLDVQTSIANNTMVKTGPGVLRLAGLGYNGFSVTLNEGTLALANDSALGIGVDAKGNLPTFTLAGGTVTSDSGNLNGSDRTIPNPIALTGDAAIGASLDGTPRAIAFNGDLTVTGNRTLTVNNTAATTFAGAVNMSGNTLTMDGTGNTLISGVVSGNADGGLTKEGTGTLTLTANNTYSGQTEVGNGKLFVNNVPVQAGDSGTGSGAVFVDPSGAGTWLGGTGTIGGNTTVGSYPPFNNPLAVRAGVRPLVSVGMATLTPGAAAGGVSTPGILTFNGNLTLTSGSTTTELDIAGTDPGTGYDQVKVGGNLALAGNLTLALGAGTKVAVGETFYVFDLTSTAGTVTGTFENANPDGTYTDSAGDVYTINYAATDPADGDAVKNDVSLTVLSVPEPGTWAMLGLGAVVIMVGRSRGLTPRRGGRGNAGRG